MPETDVIPTSASVASTGTSLRTIGNHIYGYSGALSVANTETDLINSNSGSGYIVGNWAIFYIEPSGASDDYRFRLYFNQVLVASVQLGQQRVNDANVTSSVSNIIIPPEPRFR